MRRFWRYRKVILPYGHCTDPVLERRKPRFRSLDASVVFHGETQQFYEVTWLDGGLLVANRAPRFFDVMNSMSKADAHCVLLADLHHGLSEGVRALLATTFDTVVMVADEISLFESARRLQSDLAIVDLSLSRGDGLEMVRQLRGRFPQMKLIILSIHDQSSVGRSVLAAGAHGFVAKRAIATDLLAAADAVLAGQQYVSPETAEHGADSAQ